MFFSIKHSAGFTLYLWSVIAIFSELALVRMCTTLVDGMSYYGNCFYVAAIFFLGCGFMARKLERYQPLIPLMLLLVSLTIWWLSHYNMLQTLHGEFQWYSFANVTPKPVDFSLQLAVLLLVLAMAPAMITIGAVQAGAFKTVGGVTSYLIAASGGISGAVSFMLQNQYASNIGWLIALLGCMFLVSGWNSLWQRLALAVLPFTLIALLMHNFITEHSWSPYQRLSVSEAYPKHFFIYTNGIFIMELNATPVGERTGFEAMYDSVFNGLKQNDRVLVLGSGTGTYDVAVALHKGVKHVVAVEIDPTIISIADRFDPQRTYHDSRVELINSDARKFVNQETRTFNVVFLPGLDSQTNASNHSRFRLDSFLYTLDGLKAIWERVDSDGYLVMSFASAIDWLPKRLWSMLQTVTGNRVQTYWLNDGALTLFVAAKNRVPPLIPEQTFTDISEQLKRLPMDSNLPTDDTPFLYNLKRSVSSEHLRLTSYLVIMMLVIALVVARFANVRIPAEIRPFLSYQNTAASFLFGAAFFFMQLRVVSLLTPIVGSTYLGLSLVVIGTIMGSLAGSLLAVKLQQLRGVAWVLLLVCLAGSIPLLSVFMKAGTGSQLIAASVLFFPFTCAGYLYTIMISPLGSRQIVTMQMWNMIGGCIGGLFEWCVIYTGFKDAIYVAIGLYLLAFFNIALAKRNCVLPDDVCYKESGC